MAGFMAGFGSAFSQSYNNAQERSHEMKRDRFRLMYDDYISQRNKRQEWEREDGKLVGKAKKLAELYGQPEEVAEEIYHMEKSGIDAEDLLKGGWTASVVPNADRTEDVASPDAAKPLSEKAENTVDAQMVTSGLAAPDQIGQGDSLFSGNRKKSRDGTVDSREREEAIMQVAEAAGVSPDKIKQTLEGEYQNPSFTQGKGDKKVVWKPKIKNELLEAAGQVTNYKEAANFELIAKNSGDQSMIDLAAELKEAMKQATMFEAVTDAEAEAAANGVNFVPSLALIRDEKGQIVEKAPIVPDPANPGKYLNRATGKPITGNVEFMNQAQTKQWVEFGQKIEPAVNEYTKAKANFIASHNTAQEMIQLVDKEKGGDPNVLNMAGEIASAFDNGLRNMFGVITLATGEEAYDFESTAGQGKLNKFIDSAEKQLSSGALDRVAELSIKAQLMRAKATRFIYSSLADVGQTGRSVAVSEFDTMMKSIMVNNPQAFKKGIQDTLNASANKLREQEKFINEVNMWTEEFKEQHGFIPRNRIKGIDETLANETSSLKIEPQKEPDEVMDDPSGFNKVDPLANEDIPTGWDKALWGELSEEERMQVREIRKKKQEGQ